LTSSDFSSLARFLCENGSYVNLNLGSSTHVRLSLAPLKIGISQIVVCYCRLLPPRFSVTSVRSKGYGGSVWESNPPFDPLRTESPALKAGEITGPLSPPGGV
jgi:hypothetical protein